MAGTVKKVNHTPQPNKRPRCIWKAGVYSRLSVDKDDKKNESIDAQIEIAKEYIMQSDDIVLVDCYSDLGKSGTNFEREGFDRLMTDIRRHKINCVIVKDFSRFGRNYIETGNYIEKIFPFFDVRFISISDDYDSHRTQGDNDILTVNLKNIVNELYARDCAEKVREIKKSKLKQGCYIGGIPSYGYYAKWIDGNKVLFPEEGTSDIVRKIYGLYDTGSSITDIIHYLYDKQIHRPKDYQRTGHVYCAVGEVLKQWSDQTIRTILTNHVYIGSLVQIRAGERRYRGRAAREIEPDEVIMVEHTHEPIVGEDIFYRISFKMEEKRKREIEKKGLSKDTMPEDIYRNLIYCGECGTRLKRTCTSNAKSYGVSVRTYSYGCPHIQRIDGAKCDSHFISQNAINKIVLETLRKEFNLSGVKVKTLVDFNQIQEKEREKYFGKRKKEIEANIQEADVEMSSLYIQYRTGRIDKEAFLNLKAGKEMEKSNLKEELSSQETELYRLRREGEERKRFIRCLWQGRESAVLDGQVVQCLVKRITVYKDKRVEITFHFSKGQFEPYKKEARRK